jgi:EAL and modified HD-GYP domain-containing signal transduction protein
LLHRGAAGASGDDVATATVLINAVTEMGMEQICGSRPAFINCTRRFLNREPILPPDSCVLEILETVTVDPALVESVLRLIQKGYRIALDDFVYRPEWEPLLKIAHYVKVDVRLHTHQELEATVALLREYPGVLLAEKVESEEELDFCRNLGFQLFQGYYLRKPETITGKPLPKNAFDLIHLSRRLRDPSANLDEIAESIARDLPLSFRLLRVVNSAMSASRTPITSIRHAVTVAGTDLLARWVALLGLLRIKTGPGDYIELALQRACACELVSHAEKLGVPEQAYTVGLLSLLDSMLDSPWSHLIPSLPLQEEMIGALSDRRGDLGRLLLAVESFESGVDSGDHFPSLPDAFWEGAAYSRRMLSCFE